MGCETLPCDHLPVGLLLAGRGHLTRWCWDLATLLCPGIGQEFYSQGLMLVGSRTGVGLLCQKKSRCGGGEARAMSAYATFSLPLGGAGPQLLKGADAKMPRVNQLF